MAVGLSVAKRADVKEPLKAERLSFSGVRHTVVGSYKKLESAGRAFNSTLSEAQPKTQRRMAVRDTGAPFAVLLLLTDPKKVSPERNRTDIILPVKYQ
jgi:hypothetical protein